MNVPLWIGLAAGVAALAEDLGRRRISNWTSGGAVAGGLAWHGLEWGWKGAAASLAGAAAGFGVFLIFHLLGGMGGGDIKLMAGFGALLGVRGVMEAALLAAIAGGLLASGWLAAARLRRLWKGRPATAPAAIPYAPAIVAGAWLALLARG
ncbi:MAG: prepilin peptidase [Bryobacterales bacterium]|nr:prepilin peptidase [Bryobacterales bacterium]